MGYTTSLSATNTMNDIGLHAFDLVVNAVRQKSYVCTACTVKDIAEIVEPRIPNQKLDVKYAGSYPIDANTIFSLFYCFFVGMDDVFL